LTAHRRTAGSQLLSCFDRRQHLCKNLAVRHLKKFLILALLLSGGFVAFAAAETFQVIGGAAITGEPLSPNDKGVLFRLEDGSMADRVAWEKFSQADLKKILAANPKTKIFIEPLIEPSIEEKKAATKAAIVVKNDFEKLDRPAPMPLFKALFSSPLGIFSIVLIYLANIYAGFEISVFRARPPGLVCGVAAVAPFIGNIVFLCLPTQVEDKSELVQEPMREKESYGVEGVLPEAEAAAYAEQQAIEEANRLPDDQVFKRGQFTFNRRFIETKFAGYFHLVRNEADKDLVMTFATARGTYEVQRIASIGAESVNLQVNSGGASQEVTVPFLEIQEVTIRHKDA
jgi:hypothetical protein